MMTRSIVVAVLMGAGALGAPASLHGQWHLTAGVGAAGYRGNLRYTMPDSSLTRLAPLPTFLVGVGVERGGDGPWAGGMTVTFTQYAAGIVGRAIIASEGFSTTFDFAPELDRRLLRTGTGASLHLRAGPILTVHTTGELPTQWGGQLSLVTVAPLTQRLALQVRGNLAVQESFATAVTQAEFPRSRLKAAWRHLLFVGVRWRL
ncbi:MAG: hypothetical protein NW201_04300 [Gemmatimonadales bacterium]|nr:hypothetical protein [Gemmatimonadales bacterium]